VTRSTPKRLGVLLVTHYRSIEVGYLQGIELLAAPTTSSTFDIDDDFFADALLDGAEFGL